MSDSELRLLGKSLDFEKIKSLIQEKKEANRLNMVICGLSDYVLGENKEKLKLCQEILWWAVSRGGDLIFFQTSSDQEEHLAPRTTNSFFTRVQMLKGPGEAKRGTFKETSEKYG